MKMTQLQVGGIMNNEEYIQYLNSLHNYNAQNQNAYGEKNVKNGFFEEVVVKVGLCSFIKNQIENEKPHVLILTGHAGDGKTSIMYQVLKDLKQEFNAEEKVSEITLENNKKIRCIKDFSELSDDEKIKQLRECVELPNKGEFVFMVSNTGPLINTFGELFTDKEQKEKAKIELIDALDDNTGEIREICDYKISVINVAKVDNTKFAVEFVKNITKESLWSKCQECSNREYCFILRNRNLIQENKDKVLDFIKKHFIWLVEHGKRLTIRSMTEQLAYMITGGVDCNEVKNYKSNEMLFFNLFFGTLGCKDNPKANTILAIRETKKCGYDKKRIRADEKLRIENNYFDLFDGNMKSILKEEQSTNNNVFQSGWIEFLRRAYIFTNIVTDEKICSRDMEDIFSKNYERFLELRDKDESKENYSDYKILLDALSMMYLGKVMRKEKELSITLNKNSGITQNVQLIIGKLKSSKIKIKKEKTNDSAFDNNSNRYELRVCFDKKILNTVITLPMLNYFEELRNGIISTNIDPQLSHGVERLKAELYNASELVEEDDDMTNIEMIVIKNNKTNNYQFAIDEDYKIQEC